MTLVELLVASTLSVVILLMVSGLTFYAARSFAAMANYVEMSATGRHTCDLLSQELRNAQALTAFATNSITFTSSAGQSITYSYNGTTKILSRTSGSTNSTMLKGCESLTFSIYQRTPVAGSFEQYPAADLATAKLLQVNWTCSRSLFAARANNDKMVTAKIVIRNL